MLPFGTAVGVFVIVSNGGAGVVSAVTFACIVRLFAVPFLRLAIFA